MHRNIDYKIRQRKSNKMRLLKPSQRYYYTIDDAHNGEPMVVSEMLEKENMESASLRFAKDLIGAELYDLNGDLVVI